MLLFYSVGVIVCVLMSVLYTYFIEERNVELGDIINPLALLSWVVVVVSVSYHLSNYLPQAWQSWKDRISKRVVIRKR